MGIVTQEESPPKSLVTDRFTMIVTPAVTCWNTPTTSGKPHSFWVNTTNLNEPAQELVSHRNSLGCSSQAAVLG